MSSETPATAPPARVQPDDLFALKFMSDPRISPAGDQIAFILTTAQQEDNEYRSHIWLYREGQGPPRRFTNGPKRDHDPHWSPDGRFLAFVSNRTGHAEIWVIPLEGGEAARLTHTPHGAGEPRWSPDGRRLAFVTAVDEGDPAPSSHPTESDAERKARHERREKADKEQPRRITHLRYKADGQGFLEARKSHIWVVDVDEDGTAAGEPRQVTDGDWDDSQPAWGPDGRFLAFSTNRTPDRDLNGVSDVWVAPAEGGEAWPITASKGEAFVPAWSPDGTLLAYVGHENRPEGGLASNHRLYVVPMGADGHPTGERRDCTGALDRTVGSHVLSDMRSGPAADPPQWTPDSGAIYYQVTDAGRVHLYRFDPAGEAAPRRVLGGDRVILNARLSADGTRLAYDVTDVTNPGDLYTCDVLADGRTGEEHRLTHVNQPYFEEHPIGAVAELRFAAADGTDLQGWIVRPPGYEAGTRYPGVVEIHGGPHLLYGFAFFHEFQVLAAQGYAVFYMNPRGSQGYGEGFSMAIREHWDDPAFGDLMAGTDAFIATGVVDADNIGVTGGSYGGYMTCWIVGHTTRFRTAVAQRSLTNMISFYGSSDVGWGLADWEFGGLFDSPDQVQRFWQVSPLAYAPDVQTPLLLIHPENDLRCPISESEQFYVALRRLGKAAELVRFPGGSHGLSRGGAPQMRVHRLNVIRDWLRQYLGGDNGSGF
jgi:dipeptidyl aminopeptidase/acylaminoacyl peptidase